MSESYPFVYGASGSIALAVKANVNFFTSKLHLTVEKNAIVLKERVKISQKYKMRLNGIKLNVNL